MMVSQQPNLCLQVANASNNDQLELGTCADAANQAWS
jgi:hypothetical protein